MSSVVVSGLTKALGGTAVLEGLDLTVAEGSVTVVLGPSGSGKTTLLRVLAGFERADAGTISIGEDVVDGGDVRRVVPPKRRRIGYVPQDGGLFPHLTVARNIGFGLRRAPDKTRRVGELVELVGLTGLDKRFPHQLSGGQQQRVALARALAVAPPLVLLDEPFASLDAGLRATMRGDVRAILAASGTTAVLVTHDQDEALSLADSVAVMRGGRIVQQDSAHDVYLRPVDVGVALFVGVANLVEGAVEGTSVRTAFGTLPSLAQTPPLAGSTPVVVLVRPEQMAVSRGGGHPEARPGLPGQISDVQFFGHDIVVTVRPHRPCGPQSLTARATGGTVWKVGDLVTLVVTDPVHTWARGTGGA